MNHLGARVSAYVDGQLPVSHLERMTAHLASCPMCHAAVARERRIKAALHTLEVPDPDAGLLASLRSLGGPQGPMAPRPAHVPGSPRPPLVTFDADVRRDPGFSLAPAVGTRAAAAARAAGRNAQRRRWSGALVGAVTVVGAGVLSATFLPLPGGAGPVAPRSGTGTAAITPGRPVVQQNVVRRPVARPGGATSTATARPPWRSSGSVPAPSAVAAAR